MTLPELLIDPVRARIYVEVLLNKELTAQELMLVVDINRSTMSHHLSRFVKEGVFDVRIETIGRSVKYYSINPDYADEIIIEGECTPSAKKQIIFLETTSAHLQVISNLIRERALKLRDSRQLPRKRKGIPVAFTVSFISDEEARVWVEEYAIFDERVRKKWEKIRQENPNPSFDHVVFGGLTPTR